MILACYEFQTPLEIKENRITVFTVENPLFYRQFIMDIIAQTQNCSSRFTLSDDKETYLFSKNVELITDIFNLTFDSRFFQNKINQIVLEESRNYSTEIQNLINNINNLGSEVLSSLNFEANYTPISDIGGILKLFGFYLDAETMTIPERLIEYLNFLNLFSDKKLFIILNLKSIITQKEYDEFIKLLQYKKINVLLIEAKISEITNKNEITKIIDNDLCEF